MRRGVTLLELASALALAGVLTLIALPHLARARDRLAVHRAASETAAFYWRARSTAIIRATPVRLEFHGDTLAAVRDGPFPVPLFAQAGPARHGVTLDATRRVIRLGPTGLGWGAANTRLILTRGVAAETLTTSRLGRLKRW